MDASASLKLRQTDLKTILSQKNHAIEKSQKREHIREILVKNFCRKHSTPLDPLIHS